MRVNVTGQPYDYVRPWQKRAPFSQTRSGRGACRKAGPGHGGSGCEPELRRAGARGIRRKNGGQRRGRRLRSEPGVCSSRPIRNFSTASRRFNSRSIPSLAIGSPRWQLESTGALVVTEGLVTTIQMTRYPADLGQFLTYRISISMQYRDNSYTVPLVKNNKLAGLLLRFDPRTQVLDAIPAPIIAHFLKDAETRALPWISFRRIRIFPDARSAIAQVCRTNRQARRRLRHQRRAEHARGESRIAGRRHRDRDRRQRDRSERATTSIRSTGKSSLRI